MKLELVPIPVTDVDRAKEYYVGRLGFVEDLDEQLAPGVRVVQLTPPGSACSVGMGTGVPAYDAEPGSLRRAAPEGDGCAARGVPGRERFVAVAE